VTGLGNVVDCVQIGGMGEPIRGGAGRGLAHGDENWGSARLDSAAMSIAHIDSASMCLRYYVVGYYIVRVTDADRGSHQRVQRVQQVQRAAARHQGRRVQWARAGRGKRKAASKASRQGKASTQDGVSLLSGREEQLAGSAPRTGAGGTTVHEGTEHGSAAAVQVRDARAGRDLCAVYTVWGRRYLRRDASLGQRGQRNQRRATLFQTRRGHGRRSQAMVSHGQSWAVAQSWARAQEPAAVEAVSGDSRRAGVEERDGK
jgi:hypothetical protein